MHEDVINQLEEIFGQDTLTNAVKERVKSMCAQSIENGESPQKVVSKFMEPYTIYPIIPKTYATRALRSDCYKGLAFAIERCISCLDSAEQQKIIQTLTNAVPYAPFSLGDWNLLQDACETARKRDPSSIKLYPFLKRVAPCLIKYVKEEPDVFYTNFPQEEGWSPEKQKFLMEQGIYILEVIDNKITRLLGNQNEFDEDTGVRIKPSANNAIPNFYISSLIEQYIEEIDTRTRFAEAYIGDITGKVRKQLAQETVNKLIESDDNKPTAVLFWKTALNSGEVEPHDDLVTYMQCGPR